MFKFITSGAPHGILILSLIFHNGFAYQQALRHHQAHLHMTHLFSLFIRVINLNVADIVCWNI